MQELTQWSVIAVFMLVLTFLALVSLLARRFKKVNPNEVLVISGPRRVVRIVKGGGAFILPLLEQYAVLSLNAMTVDVPTDDAYTKNGVPVSVDSVVVVKVGSDDVSIRNAAERFLGFTPDKVQRTIQEVLGGHLRAICSTLTPEEINKDRSAFQQRVLEGAHQDLDNMGLHIDSFTVKRLSDKHGYFDALGKTSTAQVICTARIGEAEALLKDAIKAESLANQSGQTTKAESEAAIALAMKERDIKQAQYSALTATEVAKAEQAGPQASAEAMQRVVDAETVLAQKTAERKRQELLTEVVRPAEAHKEAVIAEAEGDKTAKVLAAEATASEIIKTGQAEADVVRSKGSAEGSAIEARLAAEANGLKAKAEAMQLFTDATMRLEIAKETIHILPEIIKAVAAPIGSVDSIKIMDFGSGSQEGGPLNKLLNLSPQTIARADEVLRQTIGVGISQMINKWTDQPLPPTTHAEDTPD